MPRKKIEDNSLFEDESPPAKSPKRTSTRTKSTSAGTATSKSASTQPSTPASDTSVSSALPDPWSKSSSASIDLPSTPSSRFADRAAAEAHDIEQAALEMRLAVRNLEPLLHPDERDALRVPMTPALYARQSRLRSNRG